MQFNVSFQNAKLIRILLFILTPDTQKEDFMNNRDISGKDIPIIQILPTAPQGST